MCGWFSKLLSTVTPLLQEDIISHVILVYFVLFFRPIRLSVASPSQTTSVSLFPCLHPSLTRVCSCMDLVSYHSCFSEPRCNWHGSRSAPWPCRERFLLCLYLFDANVMLIPSSAGWGRGWSPRGTCGLLLMLARYHDEILMHEMHHHFRIGRLFWNGGRCGFGLFFWSYSCCVSKLIFH